MTNTSATPAQADTDKVEAFILNYQPQLLTPGQRAVMLTDIKAAVTATAQPSTIAAGRVLASLCRFVADVAPRAGCPLAEVLNDVQLARWTAEKKHVWGEGRTLSNHVGRVRQVLRHRSGLPSRILPERRRRVGAPPLPAGQYAALRDLCLHAPMPVARAFAAAIGAGRPGGSGVGGRLVADCSGTWLVLTDGSRRRVLDEAMTAGEVGQVVDAADWDALVDHVALHLRLRLDHAVAYQTFRDRVFALGIAVAAAIDVFRLNAEAVDQVIDFLAPVDVATDVDAQALLRG